MSNFSKLNKVMKHGKIQKVFENIWFVQGQVKMPMRFPPMKVSKSMTIIRNPENNELTLINTMPLDKVTLEELASLGDVKNTLRIGGYHGRDDSFYKEKYGTKAYALKGHVYAKKFEDMTKNSKDGYFQADVWLDKDSALPIPNSKLYMFEGCDPIEAILCVDQDGGVLVTGDSLQNTAKPDQFCSLAAKLIMKKMGFYKAYNVGPAWAEFAKPSLQSIRAVLDLDFQNVLPGHGDAVIGEAKEKFRPALEGKIKGCHG